MRVASLPMYNFPEIQKASQSLWKGIAKYLRAEGVENVPTELTFGQPIISLWSDPNLLFSQCCGYDVVRRFKDKLIPLAVPHFEVDACIDGEYSSLIVVREDSAHKDVLDMGGCIAAINGPESHSGMSSLRHLVAPKQSNNRFFSDIMVSGTHLDSISMVRAGFADVAAIDCVTYTLLAAYNPEALEGVRVLGSTYHAPAPPYITNTLCDDEFPERLRTALFRAFEDPDLAPARHALFLKKIEWIDIEAYWKVVEFEDYAANLGFPVLQ